MTPSQPTTPILSINSILDAYDSSALAALSDQELRTLLEPYIPQARKAQLPEEKAKKEGVEVKHIKTMLAGLDAGELERMIAAHKPTQI